MKIESWIDKLSRKQQKKKELRYINHDSVVSESIHTDHIKREYGITPEDYNHMFTEQGGKCAICGVSQLELSSRLCVDHDHNTGKVRGLLCPHCNTALGYFRDNLASLEHAVEYIKRTS